VTTRLSVDMDNMDTLTETIHSYRFRFGGDGSTMRKSRRQQ